MTGAVVAVQIIGLAIVSDKQIDVAILIKICPGCGEAETFFVEAVKWYGAAGDRADRDASAKSSSTPRTAHHCERRGRPKPATGACS